MTITAGTEGCGRGQVCYEVGANFGLLGRTFAIDVGDQVFGIGQDRPGTPTVTATRTTPSPTVTSRSTCIGDCDGDGMVTVDEVLTMVNIGLGRLLSSECEAGDANHDGFITVDEITAAVNRVLDGCNDNEGEPLRWGVSRWGASRWTSK
ncbi:MAG TPA: hypothetical protein VKJ47_14170 [Candidatus Binatia bacterium]|nr:hypothetical protein [Candidatus Binatia bacterium]